MTEAVRAVPCPVSTSAPVCLIGLVSTTLGLLSLLPRVCSLRIPDLQACSTACSTSIPVAKCQSHKCRAPEAGQTHVQSGVLAGSCAQQRHPSSDLSPQPQSWRAGAAERPPGHPEASQQAAPPPAPGQRLWGCCRRAQPGPCGPAPAPAHRLPAPRAQGTAQLLTPTRAHARAHAYASLVAPARPRRWGIGAGSNLRRRVLGLGPKIIQQN